MLHGGLSVEKLLWFTFLKITSLRCVNILKVSDNMRWESVELLYISFKRLKFEVNWRGLKKICRVWMKEVNDSWTGEREVVIKNDFLEKLPKTAYQLKEFLDFFFLFRLSLTSFFRFFSQLTEVLWFKMSLKTKVDDASSVIA